MTLVTSGQLSIGGTATDRSINLELSLAQNANSSLNQTNFRTLANVSSGTISIQATLETTPTDDDWFSVDFQTFGNDTGTKIVNFTGNYIWLRAVLIYTDGTVNSIVMNH